MIASSLINLILSPIPVNETINITSPTKLIVKLRFQSHPCAFVRSLSNIESPILKHLSLFDDLRKKKKKETSIQSYVCQFTLRSKTNCSRILQNITRLNIKKMGKILERSRFSMSREYFDIVSLDECLSNCEKICPVLINNKKKFECTFSRGFVARRFRGFEVVVD